MAPSWDILYSGLLLDPEMGATYVHVFRSICSSSARDSFLVMAILVRIMAGSVGCRTTSTTVD